MGNLNKLPFADVRSCLLFDRLDITAKMRYNKHVKESSKMAKFVLETSLLKDAPQGYHFVRQALGFSTKCEACGTQSKALSFFRCSEKNADPKNPLTKYEGGMTTVCSVDCYVTTADYVAENTLQSHNDRVTAKATAK